MAQKFLLNDKIKMKKKQAFTFSLIESSNKKQMKMLNNNNTNKPKNITFIN